MKHDKGEGDGILHNPKAGIMALFFIIALVLVSCVIRPSVDSWADASLVAEQRAEIERLRNDLSRMGKYQLEVSERIDIIANGLTGSLERCDTIEELFREVDEFVRNLITENKKLRAIQQPDS